ncbi:hypothetical protein PMAYCL1PPCAC_24892, partial [Pristionchus mayeri]
MSLSTTLVINGKKVYASKQILAVNSPVFKTMFFGNFAEKNKKEIELNDVDRREFVALLIYPSFKMITDDSAESLLKLTGRFQMVSVIDRVEEFLAASVLTPTLEKLRIADQ